MPAAFLLLCCMQAFVVGELNRCAIFFNEFVFTKIFEWNVENLEKLFVL